MAKKSTARKESKYKPPPDYLRDNLKHTDKAQHFELMTNHTLHVTKTIANLKDYFTAYVVIDGKQVYAGSFDVNEAIDKLLVKVLGD